MTAPPNASTSGRLAHRDFFQGLAAWRLWLRLGVQAIRIRYRRTYLGPFWITLSMTATFVSMGMLFSAVLKNDVHIYLPYLAAGMVTWNAINSMATESPQIFVHSHHIIHSLRLPLPVYVLRTVVQNIIIFAHNCLAAIAAHLILGGTIGPAFLMVAVTLPILVWVMFSIGLILAILGARFRDLGPIVGVALQFLFFLTPIMWSPADIPQGRKWWVMANPFHHLLEIIRSPLLNKAPALISVEISLAFALVMGVIAYAAFCLFRRRIAYWL
jgi:ABC-type polysaccharide/polyol phosphate export permease